MNVQPRTHHSALICLLLSCQIHKEISLKSELIHAITHCNWI